MKPLKAIIVDDIRLIRAELKLILGDFPEIEIVGEAASVGKALNLIAQYEPDVVFLTTGSYQEKGRPGHRSGNINVYLLPLNHDPLYLLTIHGHLPQDAEFLTQCGQAIRRQASNCGGI